jgi:hypothetical protein
LIYQLPSGKIINISIDQYLSMSDDDLKYCSEQGFGEDPYESIFDEHPLEIISLDEEEDLLNKIDDSFLDELSDIV